LSQTLCVVRNREADTDLLFLQRNRSMVATKSDLSTTQRDRPICSNPLISCNIGDKSVDSGRRTGRFNPGLRKVYDGLKDQTRLRSEKCEEWSKC